MCSILALWQSLSFLVEWAEKWSHRHFGLHLAPCVRARLLKRAQFLRRNISSGLAGLEDKRTLSIWTFTTIDWSRQTRTLWNLQYECTIVNILYIHIWAIARIGDVTLNCTNYDCFRKYQAQSSIAE